MNYLGGKERIADKIVQTINLYRNPNTTILEPFCGGLSITSRLDNNVIASDTFKPIITLYKELQKGWEPPDFVSEEEYQHYKSIKDENDPMTAFVGIGCSFAGKWFGGYAKDINNSNYAIKAKRSLKRKIDNCKDVKFDCKSYKDYNPKDIVIYCDPPYENTTGYASGNFDSEEFWDVMRKWSENNLVFISEYNAPEDFILLDEHSKTLGLHTKESKIRTEKLYTRNFEPLFSL